MNDVTAIELDVPLSMIPHADQWLGIWAMHDAHFEQLATAIQGLNVKFHLQQQVAARGDGSGSGVPPYPVNRDGIATISVRGRMQKNQASFGSAASTVVARQQLQLAMNDEEVKGILLEWDTPGGTVAGTQQLADTIAKASARKPVYSFCDDMCCSAGYWAASQAAKVFCNPTCIMGSIGTYMSVLDWSALYAKEGVKVHIIRAGAFKGAGSQGTEITAEHLADFQREVAQLNDQFVAGVAAGRKLTLDQAKALADGRVHVGQSAVDLKLVDAVASAEDVVAELISVSSASNKTRNKSMSTQTDAPKGATLAELKAAFPKATADWREAQQLAGVTLEQASKNYISFQEDQLAAANKRADEAEKKAAADAQAKAEADKKAGDEAVAKAKKPGNDPVVGKGRKATTASDGDPIADFDAAVQERMKANGGNRRKAIAAVVNSDAELHRAYLEATNDDPEVRGKIAKRFAAA